LSAALTLSLASAWASPVLAEGEGDADGFPSWAERALLELTNRARVDPQLEMSLYGAACSETACHNPQPPLYYSNPHNRSARFHSANMARMSFFAHDSPCTLVSNIGTLYPNNCDGSAACSCVGGQSGCNPTCDRAWDRVAKFGGGFQYEIIASAGDPETAFYMWLYESGGGATDCQFTLQNGHRWAILEASGGMGYGVDGGAVGDFGGAGGSTKLASGSHWPEQAAAVEAWANWVDSQGPSSALVNVDGACTAMTLGRGPVTNGAYQANLTGVGSGCHHYFFLFHDSASQIVTYPTTGSLGIGCAAAWDSFRPTTGASCNCQPQCGGKQCGNDSCGGSCGNCPTNTSCQSDQCVHQGGTGGAGGSGAGGSGAGGSGTGGSGNSGATSAGGSGNSGGAGTGGSGNHPPLLGDDNIGQEGLIGTCACRVAGVRRPQQPWLSTLLGPLALVLRRRTRRRSAGNSEKSRAPSRSVAGSI